MNILSHYSFVNVNIADNVIIFAPLIMKSMILNN